MGFAQEPIVGYYGYINDDSATTDGTGVRSYNRVTSASPLDQSATGANLTWNFNQLTAAGTSYYHNVAPTSGQTAQYPGTTRAVDNSVTIGGNTTMSRAFFNGWAFTGVENADFTINYTDNGVFSTDMSMAYNETHSETIAGTYLYDGYNGTFTGTISGVVDAYGTLNLSDAGFGSTSDDVTRLKIVQSLSLQYPGFGTVGTAVFTSYHYYRQGDLYPFFTSTTSDFNIPLLSIDEEQTMLEAAIPALLGVPAVGQTAMSIAPNPVKNLLQIQSAEAVRSIRIADTNGRVVLSAPVFNNGIDLSPLAKGVYIAQINTDSGMLTRKIVKE